MPRINPSAPTVVQSEKPELPTQGAALVDAHLTGDARVQSLVDQIYLYQLLAKEASNLKDQLKVLLLSKGFKYGDGELAYAVISDSKTPRTLVQEKAAAAVSEKRLSIRALMEIGAITFDAKKLTSFFTGNEIDRMCEDGTPSAPTLSIKPSGEAPPPTITQAIEKLAKAARSN
jgi:hypothetical protein